LIFSLQDISTFKVETLHTVQAHFFAAKMHNGKNILDPNIPIFKQHSADTDTNQGSVLLTKPNAPDNGKDMYFLLILFIYFFIYVQWERNQTDFQFRGKENNISFRSIPSLSSPFLFCYIRYT